MKVRKSAACASVALDKEWCAEIEKDYNNRHK